MSLITIIDENKNINYLQPNCDTEILWTEWNRGKVSDNIDSAVEALRRQSK